MNIFNPIDPIEFAKYVIAHWGGGVGGHVPESKLFEKECNRLMKECEQTRSENFSKRIYLLEAAGDMLVGESSIKGLELKSSAYSLAGATCRTKAIPAIIEYLNKETNGRNVFMSFMSLGKAYNGEKQYDNALKSYKAAFDLYKKYHFEPSRQWYGIQFFVAETYEKMKDFDNAISALENTTAIALSNPAVEWNVNEANKRITLYKERKGRYEKRKKNKKPPSAAT